MCCSILTGSYDGIARVWNTDGKPLLDTVQCAGHSGQPIKCVTWISDGMLSYCMQYNTVLLIALLVSLIFHFMFLYLCFSSILCLIVLNIFIHYSYKYI